MNVLVTLGAFGLGLTVAAVSIITVMVWLADRADGWKDQLFDEGYETGYAAGRVAEPEPRPTVAHFFPEGSNLVVKSGVRLVTPLDEAATDAHMKAIRDVS
jgi:hypothetical protein